MSYIAQTIHEIDHDNGSLLFHRLVGWLPLKTIEKPLGAIVVAPKTIVKPLGPMVGGAIEKPFHHGFSTMESKIIENH